ncbi:uncharacterized protein LOC111695956 [Eurytemora carolleeae]|uniref:uncharacterized protein LOC111695956 n=1 Tax=Eurytemora carolleeae TaxID=1294199 RepID=UPI000C775B6C|nr:uncharacterized protein LOC111695956 [Eurytemora carolleeae]|eukprot:XP_023321218.1 uncharacterized protein LOC111695956 [Eurytemora affinis]
MCARCGRRFAGFITDHEQRKVWGMGVLYLLGFPILLLMIVVGGIKAAPPGEENPNCPAEPNMPWFLIIGGCGITILLILRIAINKCLRCLKENERCCDEVMGCFCEFGCSMVYDIFVIILIVLWMITVTWWVFRHRMSDQLYSILGHENLDTFRASLGDNDTIHHIQFDNPEEESYCDRILYEVSFALLSAGWLVLAGALLVFIIGKVCYSVVCCQLCRSIEARRGDEEEEMRLNATKDKEEFL